jgi:hypothetical protein
MLEFIEEPLDEVALFVEPLAEPWRFEPSADRPDVGPGATFGQTLTQGVGIISPVAQQHVAASDRAQHVFCAVPVMGLAFGELEQDRQAAGINERVDLGRQPAARATHATGSRRFFWPLAAC